MNLNLNLMPDLLDFLVCPSCRGKLDYTDDAQGMLCAGCGLVYRIEDDIPILLVEEAVSLEEWEKYQSS